MRILSPNIAPPVKGLDGSTATTATLWPSLRTLSISTEVRVDLPEPGAPVSPRTYAFPDFGNKSASTCSAPGRLFSTRLMRRARERRSPSSAVATRGWGMARSLESPEPQRKSSSLRHPYFVVRSAYFVLRISYRDQHRRQITERSSALLLETGHWQLGTGIRYRDCLLYTSPSPRDGLLSRMPSSA